MGDLRELFSEVILDHYKSPRNFRVMPDPTRTMPGRNPLCGDHLVLYLKLDGEKIAEVAWQGSGCAIASASSSIMTQAIKGKTIAEAQAMFGKFHAMVTRDPAQPAPDATGMGSMAAFSGVAEFPVRVKCATLAWQTLDAALKGVTGVVSTETTS